VCVAPQKPRRLERRRQKTVCAERERALAAKKKGRKALLALKRSKQPKRRAIYQTLVL
jgi:hypothetical protein